MNKSAILTTLGIATLGYTKSRFGSLARKKFHVKKITYIQLRFLDWYGTLYFTPEMFAVVNQELITDMKPMQMEINIPNRFPEVRKIVMELEGNQERDLNQLSDDKVFLNIGIRFELYPNTFLDVHQNRSAREHIDELAGRLFPDVVKHISENLKRIFSPYHQYPDRIWQSLDQDDSQGHEDWLSDDWNPDKNTLNNFDFYTSFGKNNVLVNIFEKHLFTDSDGNIVSYNQPNKSNLRRR